MKVTKSRWPPEEKFMRIFFPKLIFLLLALVSLGFLGYRFRGKFLAGIVNGQPIFKFQLTKRLYSQYGRQVLEDLIVEKLILQEAKKKGISISKEELSQSIEKIKDQLGPQADLDSVLALQGIKKSDFESQLKVQILVKKLLEKEISISDEEVAKFIKENRKLMEATTEAELAQEAKERLTNQSVTERLNPWIDELIKKAKILSFVR